MTADEAITITGPSGPDSAEVLTEEAVRFVADLERTFRERRRELLRQREARQRQLSDGGTLGFAPETESVRSSEWSVAAPAADLVDRRVEITGPTDRKMVVNALNSGAKVFMADFEDSNTPTWENLVSGQHNLADAIDRRIDFTSPDGKAYRLTDSPAVLIVRPRGWHLPEKHLLVDGEPVSGALFDFGLYFFHCARRLLDRGSGPYFYLPKLENHLEARLWNDVFGAAQAALNLPRGTIRATVLIETITAAFEMEEILYELREHSAGLNAGRWDYMFSLIKKFRTRGSEFLLPDRNSVTMTVPFMRAYSELLVATCHRRGAHAIGGMAAFIPSRRDAQVNETALTKVRQDKQREAGDGFDGSWVAHPDLVPVCRAAFDEVLGEKPNQLSRRRDDVHPDAAALLDVRSAPGRPTEAGLRNNVSVALQYLESWLRGYGAVAIFNLMEDAATAEIARSQVWQWIHNDVRLEGGQQVTPEFVEKVIAEELAAIRSAVGEDGYAKGLYLQAVELFREVALADDFAEFLTLPAYERLP